MNIKELQNIIIHFRDERDRVQFHNPKDLASAITIEAWELMEHFLWKNQNEAYNIAENNIEVEEEFADIMNYLLLFAHSANIDIEKAVKKKIEKNAKKYPIEKSKWNNTKYNKL